MDCRWPVGGLGTPAIIDTFYNTLCYLILIDNIIKISWDFFSLTSSALLVGQEKVAAERSQFLIYLHVCEKYRHGDTENNVFCLLMLFYVFLNYNRRMFLLEMHILGMSRGCSLSKVYVYFVKV